MVQFVDADTFENISQFKSYKFIQNFQIYTKYFHWLICISNCEVFKEGEWQRSRDYALKKRDYALTVSYK